MSEALVTPVEFDVETTGLQHHGAETCELFLAAFKLPDGEVLVLKHPEERERIQELLLTGHEAYRAWNAKFDLHILAEAGYELPPEETWIDGMVDAHIMDDRSSVALKARGSRMFGDQEKALSDEVHDLLKVIRRERQKAARGPTKKDPDRVPVPFVPPTYRDIYERDEAGRKLMTEYAAQDVVLQRKIGDQYDPEIAEHPEFPRTRDLERRVLRALFRTEQRGIKMDRPALAALEADVLPDLDRRWRECAEIAEFEAFNPGSWKHVGEALDRLADTQYMERDEDTGNLKTDRKNLERCDHPLADAILGYRGEHKLYAMVRGILHTGSNDEKFPAPYLTAEDRVHPNFRQIGAQATARMSCANPNFQQVHRDDLRVRYAVEASPGKKLVTCDLDSIELRVVAAFAGDGALRRALLTPGADLHQQTADAAGLTGRTRTTGAFESARGQGKVLNYSIIYGAGKPSVMGAFQVDEDRAGDIIRRYHEQYPEITQLQNRIEEALLERGYLKCPLTGRRWRMYGRGRRAVNSQAYKFLNYLVQGTAASVLKIAYARCHEAGVPLIAAVHDEIIAEPDEDDAEECGAIIEEAMTTGFDILTDQVPFIAEAQIVDRWSAAKDPDYIPDYLESQQ